MTQNIYDDPEFFAGYSRLRRSLAAKASVIPAKSLETADPVENGRVHAELAQVVRAWLAAGFDGTRSGDCTAKCREEIAYGG